jgi:serine/threonine-protein kinase
MGSRLEVHGEVYRSGRRAVYQGKYTDEDGFVAIKEFDKANPTPDQGEMTHLRKIRHPWIITYRDCIEPTQDTMLLVLEWFEGFDLYTQLRAKQQSLNQHRLVSVFDKILSAVHHAHINETIHRDIKPDNIFVNDALDVRVMDFGLARDVDHTASHTFGSIKYRSPQHHAHTHQGAYVDIFPLGLMLYEVFTGQFKRKSIAGELADLRSAAQERSDRGEETRKKAELEFECVSAVRNRVKPEDFPTAGNALAAIVKRAISPDPKDSYRSAEALRLDLHLAFKEPEVKQLTQLLSSALDPAGLKNLFDAYQSLFPEHFDSVKYLLDSELLKECNARFSEQRTELVKKFLAYNVAARLETKHQTKEQVQELLAKQYPGLATLDQLLEFSKALPPLTEDRTRVWKSTLEDVGELWNLFEKDPEQAPVSPMPRNQ